MVTKVMALISRQVQRKTQGEMGIRSLNCFSHSDTAYQAMGLAMREHTTESIR